MVYRIVKGLLPSPFRTSLDYLSFRVDVSPFDSEQIKTKLPVELNISEETEDYSTMIFKFLVQEDENCDFGD